MPLDALAFTKSKGEPISVGEPRPALGVDVGDGLIVRFDEAMRVVVGQTIVEFRQRLERGLAE